MNLGAQTFAMYYSVVSSSDFYFLSASITNINTLVLGIIIMIILTMTLFLQLEILSVFTVLGMKINNSRLKNQRSEAKLSKIYVRFPLYINNHGRGSPSI